VRHHVHVYVAGNDAAYFHDYSRRRIRTGAILEAVLKCSRATQSAWGRSDACTGTVISNSGRADSESNAG
jgi:hypothetical protein